jgi:sugar lactone lactonase YvrE
MLALGVALLVIIGWQVARVRASEGLQPPTGSRNITNPAPIEIPLATLPLFGKVNQPTQGATLGRTFVAAVSSNGVPTSGSSLSQPSGQQAGTNTPALLSAWITGLTTDPQGNLWISTEDNGVWRCSADATTNEPGTRFSVADGLGDNNIYAIACDGLGRIWVGHLNHGVSVYNGTRWQNYDLLTGPLGERVFRIKVNPADGDVWIATSRGLTRYSVKQDSWTYYTRADGLPSDQIQALAFDQDGTLYAGTQCDGLAVASAADNYKTWRVVRGADKLPLAPTGEGLPSSLINDLLVGRDGKVWVATTCGLAWSDDKGNTWHFVRGQDWAAKVKGLYGGPPAGWEPTSGTALAEDYVTCLAEDPDSGWLWVGYRQQGCGVLDPVSMQCVPMMAGVYATAFLPLGGDSVLLGTYGNGLVDPLANKEKPYTAVASSSGPELARNNSTPLPSPAQAPTVGELQAMLTKVQGQAQSGAVAAYLGEDWVTEGDWVGRYGRQHTTLSAMMPPSDHTVAYGPFYRVEAQIGPNHAPGDVLRRWVETIVTDDSRALYDPVIGIRRIASWDDHGGSGYPLMQEGPDIWVSVEVPAGTHRISLYFLNDNGQLERNRYRDYLVELKPPSESLEAALAQPALASARVRDFWGGVYKQFVVMNPGKYWLRIGRNNSFNTMVSAVLVDRLAGPRTFLDDKPLPWMGGLRYDPPEPGQVSPAPSGASQAAHGPSRGSVTAQLARDTWAVLDGKWNEQETAAVQEVNRLFAYRAARADGAADSTLKNWRWHLRLWTASDREVFRDNMAQAWRKMQESNPHLRLKESRPYSPQTVDSLEQWDAAAKRNSQE